MHLAKAPFPASFCATSTMSLAVPPPTWSGKVTDGSIGLPFESLSR